MALGADTQVMAELLNNINIRCATASDASALRRLAALDDAPPSAVTGDVMIAEIDGEAVAAVAGGHRAIADPFRRTAEIVELLRMRAAQLGTGCLPAGSVRAARSSLRLAQV